MYATRSRSQIIATRGERSFLTNDMNKMAGRTPGAQQTSQEMTSHSLLHNYASTLPWIDIYTANIAFPPRSHSTHAPPLASIHAQNRPRARRWKGNPATSMAVAFSGDGFRWRWNCKASNWKQIGAQEKPGKPRAGKKGGKPLYVQRRPTLAYTRPGQVYLPYAYHYPYPAYASHTLSYLPYLSIPGPASLNGLVAASRHSYVRCYSAGRPRWHPPSLLASAHARARLIPDLVICMVYGYPVAH